jgi:hypothetical protein
MRVGYAWVSTKEQSLAVQVDVLRAGLRGGGQRARTDRPILDDLLLPNRQQAQTMIDDIGAEGATPLMQTASTIEDGSTLWPP